jgi:hypothetical protein
MTSKRRPRRRSSHPSSTRIGARFSPRRRTGLGVLAVVLLLCGFFGFTTTGGTLLFGSEGNTTYEVVETNHPFYAGSPVGPQAAQSPLSTVFTAEVQYWAPLIKAWAVVREIDPNLIATVIQIESCGDPLVSSPAGALGLFQVMPFHFAAGEDMLDVQTNARRGLDYLAGSLESAEGHVGLALAGYNGGHGVISRGWAAWTAETRRYYYWGARIYAEAISGMPSSPTLNEWIDVGGRNLCARAAESQRQIEEREQARLAELANN